MRYAPLLAALMAISCRGDASSSVGTDASVSLTPPRPRSAVPASTTPTDTLSPTAAGWLWLMAIDDKHSESHRVPVRLLVRGSSVRRG